MRKNLRWTSVFERRAASTRPLVAALSIVPVRRGPQRKVLTKEGDRANNDGHNDNGESGSRPHERQLTKLPRQEQQTRVVQVVLRHADSPAAGNSSSPSLHAVLVEQAANALPDRLFVSTLTSVLLSAAVDRPSARIIAQNTMRLNQ